MIDNYQHRDDVYVEAQYGNLPLAAARAVGAFVGACRWRLLTREDLPGTLSSDGLNRFVFWVSDSVGRCDYIVGIPAESLFRIGLSPETIHLQEVLGAGAATSLEAGLRAIAQYERPPVIQARKGDPMPTGYRKATPQEAYEAGIDHLLGRIESSDTERAPPEYGPCPTCGDNTGACGYPSGPRRINTTPQPAFLEPARHGVIPLPRDCYYCGHSELTDENRCERCGEKQPPGEG